MPQNLTREALAVGKGPRHRVHSPFSVISPLLQKHAFKIPDPGDGAGTTCQEHGLRGSLPAPEPRSLPAEPVPCHCPACTHRPCPRQAPSALPCLPTLAHTHSHTCDRASVQADRDALLCWYERCYYPASKQGAERRWGASLVTGRAVSGPIRGIAGGPGTTGQCCTPCTCLQHRGTSPRSERDRGKGHKAKTWGEAAQPKAQPRPGAGRSAGAGEETAAAVWFASAAARHPLQRRRRAARRQPAFPLPGTCTCQKLTACRFLQTSALLEQDNIIK